MKIDIDNITNLGPAGAASGFAQSYTIRARVDGEHKQMVIAIDWEALATMLGRACLENKTRQTRLASGNIRAWVKR
jgi:hypothetical protein